MAYWPASRPSFTTGTEPAYVRINRHLEQHAELLAHVVGGHLVEGLRAVTALQQEPLAARDRRHLCLEVVALASKDQRMYSDNGYGGCGIVTTATPAIVLGYKVTLPRWSPPSGVSAATILWWNGEVTGIATHEKVHVDTGRATAKRLNTALAASTCANADRNLQVVWDEETRQDCEFDMKEYGSAAGLSLKACLNQ